MTNNVPRVIYERDDRNVKAWAYDVPTMSEYASSLANLEKRKFGEERMKEEKEDLKEQMARKLAEMGQERQYMLYESRVVVVGSDTLAQMVLSCLAGIGVGNIYFMDNKRITDKDRNDFLCTHTLFHKWQKKVKHIEKSLKEINGSTNITARHSRFTEAFVYGFKPEIIIDATNDPDSKEAVIDFALGKTGYSIPVISASTNNYMGALACYWPKVDKLKIREEHPDLEALLHREFTGKDQGGFPSGLIAGLITEEYRKFKFKYAHDGSDANLESNQRLVYNPYSNTRQGFENHLNPDRIGYFRDKRALVAGAGALGNFVALELALMGVGRIDIMDSDDAESSNLSRQILLRGRIGDKKSKIVAERIKEMNLDIDARWAYAKFGDPAILSEEFRQRYGEHLSLSYDEKTRHVEMISEQRLAEAKYDVIFGCFDNKYARVWLNAFAAKHKVSYIDGGTNPQSGQATVYIPGKTHCIDCQLDLNNFPERNSCQIDPSTIIPNIVVASEMVGESINVFNPRLNKDPIQSIFQYSAQEKSRFYLRKSMVGNVNNHGC